MPGSVPRSSASCIASTAAGEGACARSSAARIAATLPTTASALRVDGEPSSATAIARAPEVSCSMREDDADSVRSSTAANGATSEPIRVSNRAISAAASSAARSTAAPTCGVRPAIVGTTAAR